MPKIENIDDVPTVAELRKAGWKVRIQHVRDIRIENSFNIGYEPRGGETYVSLVPPKNYLLGKAKCSKNDSYCKKEGVKLGIKRALEQYDGHLVL
jgi:hypothetical protein